VPLQCLWHDNVALISTLLLTYLPTYLLTSTTQCFHRRFGSRLWLIQNVLVNSLVLYWSCAPVLFTSLLYADNIQRFYLCIWFWLMRYTENALQQTGWLLVCVTSNSNSSKNEFLRTGLKTTNGQNVYLLTLIHPLCPKFAVIIFGNFCCICPYLDLQIANTIITCSIHSKLDYCNSFYCNLYQILQ